VKNVSNSNKVRKAIPESKKLFYKIVIKFCVCNIVRAFRSCCGPVAYRESGGLVVVVRHVPEVSNWSRINQEVKLRQTSLGQMFFLNAMVK
jgi:hypothetical protein